MRYCLMVLAVFCLSGCLMEVVTVTAIQGELAAQNAQSSTKALGTAKDMKSKIELESAINVYAGTIEKYPATLSDLVPGYIAAIPVQANGEEFGYDPTTGKITTFAYDGGITETQLNGANFHDSLFQIRTAIYSYWEDTGYYPDSIESLAPLYYPEVPASPMGIPFRYDKKTGAVSHPYEDHLESETVEREPVGRDASPRGQLRGITDGYSQRQMKTLEDLGL